MATTIELQVVADPEALYRAAADLFTQLARRAVAEHGRFTVALSGGSTPRGVYEHLAAPPFAEQSPWEKIEFFWGDERPVPPDHPDSNYRMASDTLLSAVPLAPAQIHRMPAEDVDLERAAGAYEKEMAAVFGISPTGPPPSFDLILLGMGVDGHTASIFPGALLPDAKLPGTKSPAAADRWVVESPGPAQTANRLTLTISTLNRARCVCFLVAGGAKAETLAAVLEGPKEPDRLPSQAVDPSTGRLVWIVDQAAASRLQGPPPQTAP